MVEIKRWIATDATDHGQLISDSDLTDEAIFDRLENNIAFRSVATSLVQKYGYLQPSVNPESPMARQQELLMRERVKWQVQDEGASRARASQTQGQENRSQVCDSGTDNCMQSSGSDSSIQELPQQPHNEVPGLKNPPS